MVRFDCIAECNIPLKDCDCPTKLARAKAQIESLDKFVAKQEAGISSGKPIAWCAKSQWTGNEESAGGPQGAGGPQSAGGAGDAPNTDIEAGIGPDGLPWIKKSALQKMCDVEIAMSETHEKDHIDFGEKVGQCRGYFAWVWAKLKEKVTNSEREECYESERSAYAAQKKYLQDEISKLEAMCGPRTEATTVNQSPQERFASRERVTAATNRVGNYAMSISGGR